MSWTPRSTAPSYSSTPNPYYWPSGSQGECVWYCYYRALEGFGDWYLSGSDIIGYYPCWRSGSGSSGTPGFVDAKYWLDHPRDPWIVKSTSYTPVPGDIAVFTGTAGHNVVIESVVSGGFMVSDYNLSGYHQFGYRFWDGHSPMSTSYASTGALIGFLHRDDQQPQPTVTPELTVSPDYYNVTMGADADYIDFPFNVTLTGIPDGETASGNNSYPGLSRVANTGWSYSSYTVGGVTYQRATKSQTLRYYRESDGQYDIVKYMYYSFSYPNGSVSETTPMTIHVEAKPGPKGAVLFLNYDGSSVDIR